MPEQLVREEDNAAVRDRFVGTRTLTLDVGDDGAWRVLGSPYRMRLYESIRRLGECTIAELADFADTKPVNLYYHLRALESTGLIVPTGRRQGVARRAPVLYGAPHHQIEIEFDPDDANHQSRMENLRRSWQREAVESVETGVRRKEEGKPGQCMVHFRWESLTPEEQMEISRHFEEIVQILDRQRNESPRKEDSSSLLHIGLQMIEHPEPSLPAPTLNSRPRANCAVMV